MQKYKTINSPKIQSVLKEHGWLCFYVRQDHKKDGLVKIGRIELCGPIISSFHVSVCNQCVDLSMLNVKTLKTDSGHWIACNGRRWRSAACGGVPFIPWLSIAQRGSLPALKKPVSDSANRSLTPRGGVTARVM